MSAASRPLCVLVVDDSQDTVETAALLLEMSGFRVLTAPGGDAALTVAAAERPDVVLTDLAMPGGDGHQLARRLRVEVVPCPFLVALSGYVMPEDRERSASSGFDLHLAKPLDPAQLVALLRRVELSENALLPLQQGNSTRHRA